MLLLTALVLAQFDFGGSPARKAGPVILGESLLAYDIVQRDLGRHDSFATRFGETPVEPVPILGRDDSFPLIGWCGGGTLARGRAPDMPSSQTARLREIYVRHEGSLSVADPGIAKALQLSRDQRRRLDSILHAKPPMDWAAANVFRRRSPAPKRSKFETQLVGYLELVKMLRGSTLESAQLMARQRTEIRKVLTPRQTALLRQLGGRPLPADFNALPTTLGRAFGTTNRPDRYRAELQTDDAFAILRQDVSQKLGLDEATGDRIRLRLQALADAAYKDATEYWWLLRQPGNKAKIEALRQEVFRAYEITARRAILSFLTPRQRTQWANLVGPSIPGLKTRNHFG